MPERRRLAVVAAVMAALCAAYSATNHWHWREPSLLPLSWLDRSAPFVPAAMLVYVSHFVFLPGCLLLIRGEKTFSRAATAVLIGAALSDAFFLIFPTTYPRVPPPTGIMAPFFAFIAAVDTPANCFPSQHVGLAVLVAWALREDRHPWAGRLLAWAGLISVSTVLVKQHYAADVAGGLVLTALSWKLSARTAPAPLPEGEPA